jgi:hypothetical protein
MLNDRTQFHSKQATLLVMYLFCVYKITSLGVSLGAYVVTGIFVSQDK